MATRAELERHLQHPNVRKMLDLIAHSEGVDHGYHTMFGNTRLNDLSKHPGVAKRFNQTDGKANTSTAAGRYQFLKRTWSGLANKYGLSDFSERNQDIAALALIAEKGQLQNVLNGNLREAVGKLGGIWASLPSSNYKQPKHSWATIDEFLNNGTWKGKATSASSTSSIPASTTPTEPVLPTYQVERPQFQVQPLQQIPQTPDVFGMADNSGLMGLNFDLFTALNGMGQQNTTAILPTPTPLTPTSFS